MQGIQPLGNGHFGSKIKSSKKNRENESTSKIKLFHAKKTAPKNS